MRPHIVLRRVVFTAVKAILVCRAQRARPTATTVFEIIALASPLLRLPDEQLPTEQLPPSNGDSASSGDSGDAVLGSAARVERELAPVEQLLVVLLKLTRGFAPAVVVAQGVRLVAGLVNTKRQVPGAQSEKDTTDVRALQLGLSSVPRVDPRVPRSLDDYAHIYSEWLLLLRGRLAQAAIELPDFTFDGEEGINRELMRCALCYHLPQARSLKEALVAMDRTIANARDISSWHASFPFMHEADLEAWSRVTWWEGPDHDGYLWLMIDNHEAVLASRTQGAELVARALISNVELGAHVLMQRYEGCQEMFKVVVDSSGIQIGAALRMRGVYQRVAHTLDRMYPLYLAQLYMVGLPLPLRWTLRAIQQFLHKDTRAKMRVCKVSDVPRRLPSQLRSHRLTLASAKPRDSAKARDAAGVYHGASCGDSDAGYTDDFWSDDVAPMQRTPRVGSLEAETPVRRRFRVRGLGRHGGGLWLGRSSRRWVWATMWCLGGAAGTAAVLLLLLYVAMLLQLIVPGRGGSAALLWLAKRLPGARGVAGGDTAVAVLPDPEQ